MKRAPGGSRTLKRPGRSRMLVQFSFRRKVVLLMGLEPITPEGHGRERPAARLFAFSSKMVGALGLEPSISCV